MGEKLYRGSPVVAKVIRIICGDIIEEALKTPGIGNMSISVKKL